MFEIVLYEPEIPPNTGNIIRLVANTGAGLHLVKPLGFALDEKPVRRAGLDYHDLANVHVHDNWNAVRTALLSRRQFAISTRGDTIYSDAEFQPGDTFVFGPESRGLPDDVLSGFPASQRLRIPMQTTQRSLNLANAVSIVVYEAWRQNAFGNQVREDP